jgi:hypothetical protein
VEIDPEVLLSLIAVRLLGSHAVPANATALKGLAKSIPTAISKGLLEETTVYPLTAKGKPGKKSVNQLKLTEAGERWLRESSPPEAVAAEVQTQRARLKQSLEADRQALREQVLAALPVTGKQLDGSKIGKEIDALSKMVKDLAVRLAKLEAALAPTGQDDQILSRIDAAFKALSARLEQALGTPAAAPTPSQPRPGPPSLRPVLRTAYDKFIHFVECKDGLVDFPRLYHEAKRTLPGLTVAELHRELEALWAAREVELHVLNEVHLATEPDLGIRKNNKLLYFVYWNRA